MSAAIPADGDRYAFVDAQAPARATDYWLRETGADGAGFWHGPTRLAAADQFATHLAPAQPNAFNPRTTVSFTVGVTGRTRVEIFDLQGRRVTTLVDADLAVCRHRATWTGRDASGRNVPAGAYLLRLETADAVDSRKLSPVR